MFCDKYEVDCNALSTAQLYRRDSRRVIVKQKLVVQSISISYFDS